MTEIRRKVTFDLPEGLYLRLRAWADAAERTVSGELRRMVRHHVGWPASPAGTLARVVEDAKQRGWCEEDAWYAWQQTWADTSLGFGGMAGQMVTRATTYVFDVSGAAASASRWAFYFGGRFAYECDHREAMKYIDQQRAPAVTARSYGQDRR